jgi:hypothetical protein
MMRQEFAAAGSPLPENLAVSCSWPSGNPQVVFGGRPLVGQLPTRRRTLRFEVSSVWTELVSYSSRLVLDATGESRTDRPLVDELLSPAKPVLRQRRL